MGVNPTPSNFKTFTFDNTNSAQYGVYITGEGVFNAPERNVELIDIPGRNGAYALDKGSFNNIEVTYPAGIVADTEADFAKAVSDLRNFLCSKSGYCRLTDDYNSGEYRVAIYKSGLEVSHEGLLTGEFDITFECKPQRFLTSGETKQTLTSGNAITNPTLFPSKPQLQVYGYGDIDIGGQEITVGGTYIGDVVVINTEQYYQTSTKTITFDDTYANTSDTIKVGSAEVAYVVITDSGSLNDVSISASGDVNYSACDIRGYGLSGVQFGMRNKQFVYGTPSTLTGSVSVDLDTVNYGTLTATFAMTMAYDGADGITVTYTPTLPTHITLISGSWPIWKLQNVIIDSTQSTLGNPIYIDLDIGEAYKIENGSAVSVNNAVQLPAELPTLPSGSNTITFDNTFTKVDIVPRWWKV